MLANKIILHNSEENLAVYASEGDAVLLTGRAWEYQYEYQYEYQRESKREHVRDRDHDQVQDNHGADVLSQAQAQVQEVQERDYMPAAPHRSPDLKEDELRVLLVVDIL